ncbi:hypothetical protein [Ilumatobacter coccineus]|uniref:hypothetical protein n=1 Tax=Ilumatobacter coccineus TaxID=467094 RepID=UPI000347D0E5|nr:hypothetical protein [Ilumatobacter coccineus]
MASQRSDTLPEPIELPREYEIPEVLQPDVIELPEGYDDPIRLSADVDTSLIASYGYTIEFGMDGIDERGELVTSWIAIDGTVDRVGGVGQWSISADDLESSGNDFVPIHPDVERVVWVQDAVSDRQAVLGISPVGAEAGSPIWWDIEEDTIESAAVFMVERTLTIDELWEAASIEPISTTEVDDGLRRSDAVMDAARTASYDDVSILDLVRGATGDVSIEAVHDAQGRVHSVRLEGAFADDSMTGAGASGSVSVVVQLRYPGDVDAIAEPIDPQPLPSPDVEPTIVVEPDTPLEPSSERPIVEMKIIGAWERDDELLVSVDETGLMTVVTDRSVYSSVRDFNALRLSEHGHRRLADRLRETGIYEHLGRLPSDSGKVGPDEAYASMTINGAAIFRLNDYRRPPRPDVADLSDGRRTAAEDAIDLFVDLSWLEPDDIAEPLGPWVPESMSVAARAGVADRSGLPEPALSDTPEWPYERSIEEMSTSVGSNAYDEPTLDFCLRGDEVAPLFELLTGVNHAYLRVADGGVVWELNVQPSVPASSTSDC